MSLSSDQPEDPANPEPPAALPEPQPVWAKAATEVRWEESEPLEYHQLLRGAPRFRWWKPVLGLFVGTVYYFTFSVVYSMIIAAAAGVFSDTSMSVGAFESLFLPDTQNPLSLVMALGSIALMIPAALLGMLSVGLSPAGRLWSVALRIRWRWIGRTILPAVIALLVINGVGIFLDIIFASVSGTGEPLATEAPADFSMNAALWSVLLILLLVPLQASAEELVFRGAFMQAIGSWRNRTWFIVLLAVGVPAGALALYWFAGLDGLTEQGGRVLIVGSVLFAAAALMRKFTGSPFIAVALPSLVFALAHIYELWGMLSVGSMALIAAWLVWRTGGLEAAITLHIVNNLVGFMFMVFAVGGQTGQSAEGGSPAGLLAAVAGQVFFAWWVDRDFKRNDGRRTRIDLISRPAPLVHSEIQEGSASA